MKKIFLMSCLCLSAWTMKAQTLDELKTMKAEKEGMAAAKQAEADAIKAEIADLTNKITIMSGWRTGVFGALGFSFNQSNNWQTNAIKNSTSATFSGSLSAFANRQAEKYFWNNSGNFNLGYLKFDDEDVETDDDKFKRSTDVLRFASLYGYKLNKWVAISALGEYSSSLFNINNPGILDLGAGATLTPITNLVVVVHPLNYHFAFSDAEGVESVAQLGAKVRADYTRKFKGGISWASTLTTFLPYGSSEAGQPGLFEYTWLNTVAFNVWKGIGVGFTYGLRQADFETWTKKGVTQSYSTLGLSYAF
ncbi:MAG: DUF3078 domain-containing protein [Saprospiraceae bacterium]|jgi:hypothetical protein|nr:DUF3078 domain-containing protein [Saprospiraceae bacterium]MBP9195906.1 DUF3078 domain-containing protein [Saprospiraceae bacterium]